MRLSTQHSIAAERARIIAKYLENWNPPELEIKEKPEQRPQAHRFKIKSRQSEDDGHYTPAGSRWLRGSLPRLRLSLGVG
jgi:hypothetical protein